MLLVFKSIASSSMKNEILSPLSRKYRLFDCSVIPLVENIHEKSRSRSHVSIKCLTDSFNFSHSLRLINCFTTR